MDVLEAITKRRSIRHYATTPVSRETLLGLVEAARHSPSALNKNTWRFVLVSRQDSLQRLGEVHRACKWLGSCQAAIAVVNDPVANPYWLEDSSVAACTIWLAATSMGLGAAWTAMHQSHNAEETKRRQDMVREVLGIPASLNVPIILGLGYQQGEPRPREMAALEDIHCWDRYTLPNGPPAP